MKYIETEFSKELSQLLIRHKKILIADKAGIYAIDTDTETYILLTESEVASEDSRQKIILLIN